MLDIIIIKLYGFFVIFGNTLRVKNLHEYFTLRTMIKSVCIHIWEEWLLNEFSDCVGLVAYYLRVCEISFFVLNFEDDSYPSTTDLDLVVNLPGQVYVFVNIQQTSVWSVQGHSSFSAFWI